ncbi:MAG: hypothetical protein PHQ12_12015 [Chthoniobacteraceae bacterium]|nr:hypothetical protein [Chthoniobacteraceae bacterium]
MKKPQPQRGEIEMQNVVEKEVPVLVEKQRKELERDEKEEVAPGCTPVKPQDPLEPKVAGHGNSQKDDKGYLANAQEKKQAKREQRGFIKPFRRIPEKSAQAKDHHHPPPPRVPKTGAQRNS